MLQEYCVHLTDTPGGTDADTKELALIKAESQKAAELLAMIHNPGLYVVFTHTVRT